MQSSDGTTRVPATVFASLRPGVIRILVLLDYGVSKNWIDLDVPAETVPIASRLPNSTLWVTYKEGGTVERVDARTDDDWLFFLQFNT